MRKTPKKEQIKPVGPRILVTPEKIEEFSAGGIVIPKEVTDREQLGQVSGRVVSMGKGCFKNISSREVQVKKDNTTIIEYESQEWCDVGDVVIYQRYAGAKIPDENSENGFIPDLVILNDSDIIAVIEE